MITSQSLAILLVDDSMLYHRIVGGIIAEFKGATVIGSAANGQIALEKMRECSPDLILLDVEMPVMNGLETLEVIKKERPEIGVIMISGAGVNSADVTVKALEMGAFGFIPKPTGIDSHANREELKRDIFELLSVFAKQRNKSLLPKEEMSSKALVGVVVKDPQEPPLPAVTSKASTPQLSAIDIVVIGVSTGGPNALAETIPKLPADIGVPILLVQHMPPLFTKSLAENLDKKSLVSVKEAEENEFIKPNFVYIAPGGKHMVVRKYGSTLPAQFKIGLTDGPAELNCKPSVNVLFRSVAAGYEGNVMAVVMTGMGTDGCDGVKSLKRKGCYCLVQDESSSTVYGMPRAVIDAALHDEIVPLEKLSQRMTQLVRETKRTP